MIERMKTRSNTWRISWKNWFRLIRSEKFKENLGEKFFGGVDSTKKGDYRGPRITVSSERSRARGVGWWWKAFDAVATTLASWKRC